MPAPTALLRRPEDLAEAARVPLPQEGGLTEIMTAEKYANLIQRTMNYY